MPAIINIYLVGSASRSRALPYLSKLEPETYAIIALTLTWRYVAEVYSRGPSKASIAARSRRPIARPFLRADALRYVSCRKPCWRLYRRA